MKKIEAIIKPFKLDDVKEALTGRRHHRHDRDRGPRLRPPEGPHRDVSRRRVHGRFPAEDQDRDRRPRRAWRTRWSRLVAGAPGPAALATAKVFVEPLEEAFRIRTGERGRQTGSDVEQSQIQ